MRNRQAVILVVGLVSLTQVRPQSPQELSTAATTAMQHQDYQKAAEYYEKLLQLVPNAAEIHSNLGLARYFQKKIGPAEKRRLRQSWGANRMPRWTPHPVFTLWKPAERR